MTKTIAYLRVSTADQNNEKFKNDILKFANARDLRKVKFIEEKISGKIPWKERKIGEIINRLDKGDTLIVPELSRLSRSLKDILDLLKAATGKGIVVYSVKEGLELSDNNPFNQAMIAMLGIMSQLERDLISIRTKEGIAAARAKGVTLGRPKGPGKSKLDKYREEIIALLNTGSTQKYIATRYHVTPPTLCNWLSKNEIKTEPIYPEGGQA